MLVDELYSCRDGHSLIANNGWVIECPPTAEIVSRSTNITVVDDLSLLSASGNFSE